jgi:hypothetical protein
MDYPNYTHERNYGCRLTEYVYKGLKTITLENEIIRVTILIDKGTDIIEFLHKPTDTDFMWRSPLGVRNPNNFVPTIPRNEGAFLDYYEGGWQECMPTGGNAATYKGVNFGPHGEVCLIPWEYTVLENSPERISVKFWVRTYRTPFLLEKVMSMDRYKGILTINEKICNEGEENLELVWGHHPAFGRPFLDKSVVIDLAGATVKTVDTGSNSRTKIGKGFEWPMVPGKDGSMIDLSKVPEENVLSHDLAFLTNLKEGWYSITNTSKSVGFGMVWPLKIFKSLWFWQVYGGSMGQPWYGRTFNIALEPWTTPNSTINEAIKEGTHVVLKSRKTISLEFKAVAHSGFKRVTKIDPEGRVYGDA